MAAMRAENPSAGVVKREDRQRDQLEAISELPWGLKDRRRRDFLEENGTWQQRLPLQQL
jgi:hypothetical protein